MVTWCIQSMKPGTLLQVVRVFSIIVAMWIRGYQATGKLFIYRWKVQESWLH